MASQHIAQLPATTISRIIKQSAASRRNCYVWGSPGIGKSALVRAIADDLYAHQYPGYTINSLGTCIDPKGKPCVRPWFRDIRLAQIDPVELCGIPYVVDGRTFYASMSWFPDAETCPTGILFFDELATAPIASQNAALEVCGEERSLRGNTLPDGWIVVAASNWTTDRAGAGRITTALADRFHPHLEMVVSWESWRDWAFSAGVNLDVIAWLSFKKGVNLYDFDPAVAAEELVFASPRSWKAVGDYLNEDLDADLRYAVFSGIIGRGQSAELCAFLEVKDKLVNPAVILADPHSAPIPDRSQPGALYATITGLCQHVEKATAENFMIYIERLDREWSVMAMEFACGLPKVGPMLRGTMGWTSWFLKNGSLMGNAA